MMEPIPAAVGILHYFINYLKLLQKAFTDVYYLIITLFWIFFTIITQLVVREQIGI